jgi:GntR family transcriptional regulator
MEPKYMTIYKELKNRILSGAYEGNQQQLPAETIFCEEFGCSRMTMKKALDLLVDEGFIYRKKGKGSFVLPKSSFTSKLNIREDQLMGLTKSSNGNVLSKIITFELLFADETIAEKLDLHVGDPVYHILRLRLVDEKPFVLERTYMSPVLIPGITIHVLEHSVYNYIEHDLNLKISGSYKITRADCSNSEDQKYLKLSETQPVLEIEQVAYLDDGTPFEYSFSRHRYDRFEFFTHSVRRNPS